MVQPFCSIYTKDYRNFKRDPHPEPAKPCVFYEDLKENFIPTDETKAIYIAERDEPYIREAHLKRLFSTYQLSYCFPENRESLVLDPNKLDEDQFLMYFKKYFSKKTHPVLPPLETARRIFHYSRFDDYYTGKSIYEEEISKEAYEFFKKDFDAGISRLFREKQKAMQEREEKAEELLQQQQQQGQASSSPQQPEQQQQQPEVAAKNPTTCLNEKICAICCEKYGDFSCGVSKNEENRNGGKLGTLKVYAAVPR